MSDAKNPKPQPGPLVEDSTMMGGVNEHGQAEIRPKPVGDGKVDENFTPTDPREQPKGD